MSAPQSPRVDPRAEREERARRAAAMRAAGRQQRERAAREQEEVFEEYSRYQPAWRLPVLFGSVVALLIFSTVLWVRTLPDKTVEMPRYQLPDVSEGDVGQSVKRLTELGFTVAVESRPNEQVPVGVAFGQEPLAGTKLELGERVAILVSSGPAGPVVPKLAGQQVSDAQALLTSLGANSEVKLIYNEDIRTGEVISNQPLAGTQVPLHSVVKLVVSQGPKPRIVPPIVGTDINSALVKLGRERLGINAINRVSKKDQPEGMVVETDPPGGTEVPRDLPVKITVVGPPPKAPVPAMTGLLQSSADAAAKAVGITLDVTLKAVPAGDPTAGRVVSQGVPAYAPVAVGTHVQVVVGVVG